MIAATAISSIGVFLVALTLLKVVRSAGGAVATARGAVAAMRDEGIDDDARERAVRQASLGLLVAFASISVRGAAAAAASLLPIWLADMAGIAAAGHVIDFLSRWDVILAATAAGIGLYVVWARMWAPN